MDSYYGISNSKVPKRNSLSPIHNFGSQNPYYHHTGHVVDPYASPDGHNTVLKNLNSPFLRYLQSGRSLLASPSSAGGHSPSIENKYHYNMGNHSSENFGKKEPPRQSRSPLPFGNAPVNVEEDVLVMDGVLVKNKSVDKSRSSSSSLTDSGSSSSSGGKNYKMDLCASYLENFDFSRYGSKCQFAHGNKELHPSPPSQVSYKNMLETPCKHYSISGTCSFGSKCLYLPPETSTATSPTEATSIIKQDESTSSSMNLKSTNWSPMDDDIKIHTATGRTPSSENFDVYINNVVYGPRRIKRLPVFNQICPE